jgi:recombination protein RecT
MTTQMTPPANGNTAMTQKKPKTLKDLLEQAKSSIAAVIPKHLSADRLIKIALVAVSRDKTGKLGQCTPESVLLAVMQAAELGIEIGGSLGEGYLVPYERRWKDDHDKWHSAMEAQFIIGYRGLINLARRSGEIANITAHVVHENDKFRVIFGLDEKLEHEPTLKGAPGELVAAYAIIRFKDGGSQVEFMTREQILDIRDRPKPGKKLVRRNKDDIFGPWNSDESEMWRKTVVRRGCKYAPLSPELKKQLEAEDDLEEIPAIDVIGQAAATEGAKELEGATPTKKLAAKLSAKKGVEDPQPETTEAATPHDPETGELREEQPEPKAERQPGEEG